jgi:hypothetical protein
MCLFCINGDDREGVGKTENVTLSQAISSDDWEVVVVMV